MKQLAAYARPCLRRSVLDIITSVVPYLAVSVLMYFALDVSYLLALVLVLPAAGFLVRTFVVFPRLRARVAPALQARQSVRRADVSACS